MKVIRWIARTFSVLIVIFHLASFLGDIPMTGLSMYDRITLGLWFMVMLGMIIAWKWEGIGSIIILVVFLVQYIRDPVILSMWAFWIAPLTGVLFLFCWMKDKKDGEQVPRTV